MKLGIMQPYFMAYIGYYQLIEAVDRFVIYDDVQYIKGGWINRNNILMNGNKFMFNLILNGASPNKNINEIYVASQNGKLLKTIENTYKKAPFFDDVFPMISECIHYHDSVLGNYIGNSIVKTAEYLGIETEIIYSSEIKKDNQLKGKDKVINICHELGATTYINAIGGRELYDKSEFRDKGLELFFLKSNPISYQQFKSEYVPGLSIIDVLMFNSVIDIRNLLKEYTLI